MKQQLVIILLLALTACDKPITPKSVAQIKREERRRKMDSVVSHDSAILVNSRLTNQQKSISQNYSGKAKLINVTAVTKHVGQFMTVQCKPESFMIFEDKDRGAILFCDKPHSDTTIFQIYFYPKMVYLLKNALHNRITVSGKIEDLEEGPVIRITDPKQIQIINAYSK
ncbi:MAG: hypothetical protein ABI367_16500 [Mucilaginibacter sp.]